MKYKYSEVYNRLSTETAVVTFRKKDGTTRVMICTRNMMTTNLDYGILRGLLDGHDKRCNIKNGNVAVIDLTIGEGRAFNIERVIDIYWLDEIKTKEELEKAFDKFMEIKSNNEKTQTLSMDSL